VACTYNLWVVPIVGCTYKHPLVLFQRYSEQRLMALLMRYRRKRRSLDMDIPWPKYGRENVNSRDLPAQSRSESWMCSQLEKLSCDI